MRVIYHDFGGTHSTATAAAIHLGLLNDGFTAPTREDFETKVPYYDQIPNNIPGMIMYVGRDTDDNDVYIVGRRREINLAENIIVSTASMLGHTAEEFVFVDVMPCVNLLMRIGGFLSRRMNLVSIGRPLVIMGTQRAYQGISTLVHNTKIHLMAGGINDIEYRPPQ